MLDKLKNIEKRYEEIGLRLSQPEAYADMTACARLQKERSQLEPLVETFRAYETCLRDLEGAKALLSDPECRELAQEELEENKRKKEQLEHDLKILLLSKDPNDERNVIVEIRAGVGGEESALFAGNLYRMYSMYAAARGWKTEIANLSETELGGIREISFVIEGEGAYSRLKFESGVHRVQRVPETEAGGRIHTSTATVAVLPEVDPVEFHLDLKDVQIDTFRSSGAGGQKVNKTSSAIRVTHLPTGMVVECQDERSQYKNKDRALSILASRLYDIERQKQADSIASERRSQVGTGMRNERIRTYNFPQGRVTDHRIGLTLYKIDQILNGDLDELIDAIVTADQAQRLQNTEMSV
ncbi:MAG: peptide chain release factor 1 [Oscillospiraceae bacterium]|nr:peptide chain release factor 1 [Oscillospiraceae bacterium]